MYRLFSSMPVLPTLSTRFFSGSLPRVNIKLRLDEAIKENLSHRTQSHQNGWRGVPSLTPMAEQIVGLILQQIKEQHGACQHISNRSLKERLVFIDPMGWIKQQVESEGKSLAEALIMAVGIVAPQQTCVTIDEIVALLDKSPTPIYFK